MIKMLNKVGIEGTYLNTIKAIHDNPIVNIMLNWWKAESFFPKTRNMTKVHTLTTPIQHSIGNLSQSNQEKEKKDIQMGR